MRRNEDFLPTRRGWGSDLAPERQSGFGSSFFGASPWQMMRRMQEDMDRVFGQFFGGQGGFGTPARTGQETGLQQWSPNIDISQTDKEWLVEVDLPGARKEDIHTEIQEHHLIIRAEMRQESEAQPGQPQGQQAGQQAGQQFGQAQGQQAGQRQYYHRERRYGYFQRVLPLAENIDEENVRCEFQNGVLTIHLPKLDQMASRGRRIPIGEGTEQRAMAGAKGGEAGSSQQGTMSPGQGQQASSQQGQQAGSQQGQQAGSQQGEQKPK